MMIEYRGIGMQITCKRVTGAGQAVTRRRLTRDPMLTQSGLINDEVY